MWEPLSTPSILQPLPRFSLGTALLLIAVQGSPHGPVWLLRIPAGLLTGTDTEAVHRDTRPTGGAREVTQEGLPSSNREWCTLARGLSGRWVQQEGRQARHPELRSRSNDRGGGTSLEGMSSHAGAHLHRGPSTLSPAADVRRQELPFPQLEREIQGSAYETVVTTERGVQRAPTLWWLLERTSFHSDSTLGTVRHHPTPAQSTVPRKEEVLISVRASAVGQGLTVLLWPMGETG